MTNVRLPRVLCAVVGDAMQGSHTSLDALFTAATMPVVASPANGSSSAVPRGHESNGVQRSRGKMTCLICGYEGSLTHEADSVVAVFLWIVFAAYSQHHS
jgi:hypothetical protein